MRPRDKGSIRSLRVRVQVTYIVHLLNGALPDADGAIVIDMDDLIRAAVRIYSELARLFVADHHFLSDAVPVFFPQFVLGNIVLEDTMLLAFLDEFPVRLKSGV